VLPFVNAAGQVVMLALIFKKAHASDRSAGEPIYFDEQLPATRSTLPIFYTSTDNGYIATELWGECMVKLVELLKPNLGDLPAAIFLDRHSTHLLDTVSILGSSYSSERVNDSLN